MRLLCALLLASCYQAHDVPCGSIVCAPGELCVHDPDRCASRDQIDACAGKADGDACTVATAPGTCRGGTCDISFCGNGVKEGLELCDQTDLGGADCTTAGFYYPDGLACSPLCVYDTKHCTGTCGDGIVDPIESCDGAAPAGLTCQDFGFDVGNLGCSKFCMPDTSACGRLGWTRVPVDAVGSLLGVWASSERDVYVIGADVMLHFDGTQWTRTVLPPGSFQRGITGTGPDDVFITDNDTIAHWNGTNWTSTTIGSAGNPLFGIWAIAPNDVIAAGYVGHIWHYDGSAWTATSSPTTSNLTWVWARGPSDAWVVVDRTAQLLHYDGSAWSAVTPIAGLSLNSVTGLGSSSVYAGYASGNYGVVADVGGIWSQNTSSAFVNAVGASRTSAFTGNSDGTINVVAPDQRNLLRIAPIEAPAVNLRAIGGDAVGHRWATGDGALVLRDRGTAWATLGGGFLPSALWGADATHVFGFQFILCSTYTGGFLWSSATSCTTNGIDAVWGTAANNVYAVGQNGTILHSTDGLGATWTALMSGTAAQLDAIFGTSATNLYVAGGGGVLLHGDGATWTTIPIGATRDLFGVWASDASHVFVVGAGGFVAQGSGTQWTSTTIAGGTDLFAVWGTSATNVWVAGANGTLVHYDGTAWTTITAPASVALRSLWGTGSHDVFAGGDDVTVLHYDGRTWSPVRVYDAAGNGQSSSAITSIWGDGRHVFFGGTFAMLDRESFPAAGCATTETNCSDAIDDDCDFLVDLDDPDCGP